MRLTIRLAYAQSCMMGAIVLAVGLAVAPVACYGNGRMGLAERHYQRGKMEGGGFMSQLTPVVKWLMVINISVFFIDMFIGYPFLRFGTYAIRSALYEFRIWEFVTFQFLHGNVAHLLFNMIGLFFFGPWMERWWGSKKFLIYYLLCGVAGAGLFTVLTFLKVLPGGLESGLIGASAGIYGIFIGVALIAPDMRVALLFPPIELSMRQLAIAVLAIAVGAILFRLGGNEGGEAGHLGGAILGYILVKYPRLLGRDGANIHKRQRGPYQSKIRPRSELLNKSDDAVDLILDKISKHGFQSLTKEEREVLNKASQRQSSE